MKSCRYLSQIQLKHLLDIDIRGQDDLHAQARTWVAINEVFQLIHRLQGKIIPRDMEKPVLR